MVEKRPVPRHKACGDVLTPRSLAELRLLDVDPLAVGGRRVEGVRMIAAGRELIEPWPSHPDLPGHGAVLRRDVLDEVLRDRVRATGASVLMGHEAIAPVVERGFVRGALLATADGEREIRSRFVVVADGANSRFGRALGTTRERDWPYGIATRSYWNSPRSERHVVGDAARDPRRERQSDRRVRLDRPGRRRHGQHRDRAAVVVPRRARGQRVEAARRRSPGRSADAWQIDPGRPLKSPTRFRVPLGGSVGPTMGPTFLVVGDAAGAANPFNGDGVNAALLTGRLAADVLDEALTTGNSTTLQRYPTLLADAAGQYDKVGRLAARFLGRPAILRPLLRVGMRSDRVMGAALRIATGELRRRSGAAGAAERAYALAATLSKLAPNW